MTIELDLLDYGPATGALRLLYRGWRGVDWFAPPRGRGSGRRATKLFEAHVLRSRAHLPGGYARGVRVSHARGRWPEFASWCERASASTSWDWRYGQLKRLSGEHTRARGWSAEEQVRRDDEAGRPMEARLVMPLASGPVVWPLHERPVLRLTPDGAPAERAWWYASYASADLTHALTWHLADPLAPLCDNPFDALLRCYARGYYPFCLAADRAVLFSFEAAP